MYSDFYEIPLPALHFEKVEETDTKKWKTTPKRNDAFQIRPKSRSRKKNDANDASKEKQIHSQENDKQRKLQNASKTKAFVIREIKLTHSKNGRH